MQQRLKSAARPAWTEVVAAQFFDKLHIAVHESLTSLDVRFGGIGSAALARDFKRMPFRRNCASSLAWHELLLVGGSSHTRKVMSAQVGRRSTERCDDLWRLVRPRAEEFAVSLNEGRRARYALAVCSDGDGG